MDLSSGWTARRAQRLPLPAARLRSDGPPPVDGSLAGRGPADGLGEGERLVRAAHELRAPAAAMLGLAELIATDAQSPLDLRQSGYLRHLVSAGQHLMSLVDELMGLSMARAGRLSIEPAWVDLNSLAAEAAACCLAQARSRGLELELHDCQDAPQVWADRRRSLQVLLNLVANAVRYNRPGGRVEVSVGPGPCISVSDTGSGLDDDQLARLFEPLQRPGALYGDAGQAREGGAGVGLALSSDLMALMGGALSVCSAPGLGTTITMELPAGPLAETAGETPLDAVTTDHGIQPDIQPDPPAECDPRGAPTPPPLDALEATAPEPAPAQATGAVADEPVPPWVLTAPLADACPSLPDDACPARPSDETASQLQAHRWDDDPLTDHPGTGTLAAWAATAPEDPDLAEGLADLAQALAAWPSAGGSLEPVTPLAKPMVGSAAVAAAADRLRQAEAAAPRASAPLAAHGPSENARTGWLLCIDDNPVNALLLQEFFHFRSDYRVRVAASAREGLALARAEPPDAVLLDLWLPDLDGLEVLRQLRADPKTRHTPVAVVSGCINPDELRRARELGARACWPKPLDLSRIDGLLLELFSPPDAEAA